MQIISTIKEMKSLVMYWKSEGNKVGFVPTMGALHQGHLSLVHESIKDCSKTVVSIFVNPTQFNNQSDLEKYPRTFKRDIELLEPLNIDAVFYPEVTEMYPEEDSRIFDFGNLDKVMEGKYRPGHFNGVAQIVSKLFDAVVPDIAFFGEKDFQQLAIIKRMVRDKRYDILIKPCPIVREKDGLAMSSRNERLSEDERRHAAKISSALFASREMITCKSVEEVRNFVLEYLGQDKILMPEYFDIVNCETLEPVTSWESEGDKIGCVAVFAGEIRLIDNIMYN